MKAVPVLSKRVSRMLPPVLDEDIGEPLQASGMYEDTRRQPDHGMDNVPEIVAWWSDGEDSRYTV